MVEVTVFQALTLLAKKYRDEQNDVLFDKVLHLFLSGVRNTGDQAILDELLTDDLITQRYRINTDNNAISTDPVRRYFESHLCAETLKMSLDELDTNLLKQNFNRLFSSFSFVFKFIFKKIIYSDIFAKLLGKFHPQSKSYSDQISYIKDDESFDFLNSNDSNALKKRKEKLIIFEKSIHAAITTSAAFNKEYPLNLQAEVNSGYEPGKRGRTPRKDSAGNPQVVTPHTLGIMRSYMPISTDDLLFSHRPSRGVRHADKSTWIEGAEQANAAFDTRVNPFVNSISGTILCQLRVFLTLYHNDKFSYASDKDQLKLYFKNFISYVLFSSGAHGLDEYARVLALPEVQEAFKTLPGFNELTLDKLFKDQNRLAFYSALDKTISYNQILLNRKMLHENLIPIVRKKHDSQIRSAATNQKKSMDFNSVSEARSSFFNIAKTLSEKPDVSCSIQKATCPGNPSPKK